MLINNKARWNVWEGLNFTINYDQFYQACVDNGLQPMTAIDFATKVGLVAVGREIYPDLPLEDAYKQMVMDMDKNAARIAATITEMKAAGIALEEAASCCGGGKER